MTRIQMIVQQDAGGSWSWLLRSVGGRVLDSGYGLSTRAAAEREARTWARVFRDQADRERRAAEEKAKPVVFEEWI